MNTAPPFIAILLKPHTALRRLAVQPRTVFGGTPCMRLYEYRYTYSTSAQAYVNHPGIGCALAHRPLHSPTSARLSAALLPLPVGLKQLARSERKGWGEGSKKSSVASTIDLYRDHFTCPNTTGHIARNPTPALPHRGRESFRCSSTFRALNNHSARASAHRLCPEKRSRAAFLLPPPQPSPTGEGSLSAVPPPFAR